MVDKITKTVDDEVAKKDLNGDGHISQEEMEMDLEFKRKELEDADARRDAMRIFGSLYLVCLLYPFCSGTCKSHWTRTTRKDTW